MKNRKRIVWGACVLAGAGLYCVGWYHGNNYDFAWPFGGIAPEHASPTDDHDHGHDDNVHSQSAGDFLELSEAAKKNLGLTDAFLVPIELKSFQQKINVPAIVVDRPGRTRLPISATMTGIVTHIHAVSGEAVEP